MSEVATDGDAAGLSLVRFAKAVPYQPPGHHGVVNRLLAGLGEGGIAQVSVWHGRVEPGGGALPHVHEDSLQVYVGMGGELIVSTGDVQQEKALGPGDAVIIPAGTSHDLRNDGTAAATLLVVSSPALR